MIQVEYQKPIYDCVFLERNKNIRTLKYILSNYFNNIPIRILDVGSRGKPHKGLFQEYLNIQSHIGIDIDLTQKPDCFADAQKIPFPDSSFDLVVSTQVLGYLRNPWEGMHEVFRVLKPDGKVVVSYHGVQFSVLDKWHFTPIGFQQLFEDCGFKGINIYPIGGMALFPFIMSAYYLEVISGKSGSWLWWLIRPLMIINNILGLVFSKILGNRGWPAICPNLFVIASR
jgi:SAM-dependent methyltransferase